MSEPAKADAVLVTLSCTAIRQFRTDPELLLYFNRTYGPVLGATRVFSRHTGPSHDRLLTADASSAPGAAGYRYHPADHPLAGQDRYEWTDAGDGVYFGTRKPEAPGAA